MAGEAEGDAGGTRPFAIGAVAVAFGHHAGGIGDRHHRADRVGMQEAAGAGSRDLRHGRHAEAVDIAAQKGAGAVVLGDLQKPVEQELGGGAVNGLGGAAVKRVVLVGGGTERVAGARQPVISIEGEGVDAVAGEVAVAVIAQRCAADGAGLVEGVRRVGGAGGRSGPPEVQVVADGERRPLVDLIVGVIEGG